MASENSLWWKNEVIYQIYPKSFQDSNGDGVGDIKGITSRLEYLSRLGVTMLWLCPIFPSPMVDNGYDISDYQAIAPDFGTMEDLDELIERGRHYGIGILLDLVLNHTSDQHEWFKKALEDPSSEEHGYYIFKQGTERPNNWRSIFGGSSWQKVEGRDEYYFHTFAKEQPDLNWENPRLRERLYEIVNWWLAKGVAGFRIDAITSIKKDQTWADREPDGADGLAKCTKAGRNQPGIDLFLSEFKERVFAGRRCLTVAEAPGVPYEQLGSFAGEDGYFSMAFDFHAADLDIASGMEWFRRLPWTIKDLEDRIMSVQNALQDYGCCANFIENHDQPRATTKYLVENQNNPDAVKTLGAMYFFLSGVPFIYQGQELGMVNFERSSLAQFNDVSSIDQYTRSLKEGLSEDEALRIVNLRSRDNARTPFPWNSERYGGFSSAKPWIEMTEEFPTINAEDEEADEESVLWFYRNLVSFARHGEYAACFVDGDIAGLDSAPDVIAYRRSTSDEVIDCYFNFGDAVNVVLERVGEDEDTQASVIWHTQDQPALDGEYLELAPFQSVLIKRV